MPTVRSISFFLLPVMVVFFFAISGQNQDMRVMVRQDGVLHTFSLKSSATIDDLVAAIQTGGISTMSRALSFHGSALHGNKTLEHYFVPVVDLVESKTDGFDDSWEHHPRFDGQHDQEPDTINTNRSQTRKSKPNEAMDIQTNLSPEFFID